MTRSAQRPDRVPFAFSTITCWRKIRLPPDSPVQANKPLIKRGARKLEPLETPHLKGGEEISCKRSIAPHAVKQVFSDLGAAPVPWVETADDKTY